MMMVMVMMMIDGVPKDEKRTKALRFGPVLRW